MILTINDRNPDAHKIHKIADILRNDGVIVYPTDTSYGFACSIFSKKAQQRIFRLKQTDERKFLSLVCYDLSQVAEYAMMSNWAYRFLKSLLPGPYTIVMNATSKVPNYMHNKRKQIGVRMPDHPIARAIVHTLGDPLYSVSVKVAGGETYCDPWQISDDFGHGVDVIVDAGYLEPEVTTILDITDDTFQVLREGKGSLQSIQV